MIVQTPIPVLDLRPEVDKLGEEIFAAIRSVVHSGHFIMGPNVTEFETEVARYLGVKHAIGVNSGTDGLFIALRTLGIGPGDEVITTPFTFFATAEAISHVGATPIFVDIDPATYNLDARRLEQAITPRTRAIIPVHLFGLPCDMAEINRLAEHYRLAVVEDVAQAFGSEYRSKKSGTLSDIAAFSFFPTKNLGAYGDGGLIATNRDDLADAAKMLRVHGSRRKYYNEVVGYNSRLDDMQAAILRVKLKHLDEFNEGRRRVAHQYDRSFEGLDGLVVPFETIESRHVYHQYTVRILNGRRDLVKESLAANGIGTMVYYPTPVHRLPVYSHPAGSKPVAELAAAEVLSLPIWPQMDAETQARVVECVRVALM